MDPDRTAQRRLAKIERLLTSGSFDEALRRCKLENQRAPGRPATIGLLARLLVRTGKAPEAVALLEQALAELPQHIELVHDLGIACQAAGWPERSEKHFRTVLESAPDYLPALNALGQLLEAQQRIQEAESHYRGRAAEGGDTGVAMQLGLARTLMAAGRLDESGQIYSLLAEQQPDLPEALGGRARLMEFEGRSAEALALLEPHIESERASAENLMIYGRLLNQLDRAAAARDVLTATLTRPDLNPELNSRVHRHLAHALDRLGEPAAAIEHLRQAHDGRGRFSKKDCVEQTDCLINYFSTRPAPRFDKPGPNSPAPVFIVGMPRAGSTLVEQILAAHGDVVAGGERVEFLNLADRLGGIGVGPEKFPARLESLPSRWPAEFVANYRGALSYSKNTRCMTDKMPPNFLFLGLIESLLPDARIIDCRRHPLDTGLSCYFQEFSGHWFDFCHDPGSIGVYYREYRRLMTHWRNYLTLPLLEVCYEDLVADLQPQISRILEFLNLPWQDSCLRFFESTRQVRTASHAQIRKPVYQNSVARHRPYLKWLAPMSDAMGEGVADN